MSDTKARILEALDALPEERQREVLDYVESLRSREEARSENGGRSLERNPLLDLIGSIDQEIGADQIDVQLYGNEPL